MEKRKKKTVSQLDIDLLEEGITSLVIGSVEFAKDHNRTIKPTNFVAGKVAEAAIKAFKKYGNDIQVYTRTT